MTPPRCILLLEPLDLPGMPPDHGAHHLLPIKVVAGELELDHHLAMVARLGPGRG